ncbi:MAG TPA: SCO family protein [Myxococcota bacterium]|nr:SCO family protein [Myxococcota bacterium]
MSKRSNIARSRMALALLIAVVLPAESARASGLAAADGHPLYELPAPGSYELPVIHRLARHELLSASGETVSLLDLPTGSCAVVSFVYASCPDAGGCPLVLSSLRRLDRALAARAALASRVQIVTVSFDPARDSPARMAMLRDHLEPIGAWQFLTVASEQAIRPVLDDFGQDALRLVAAEDDRPLGVFRHVAKVFLVDSERAIRNVYSVGFLDHEILLLDIETLLMEPRRASRPEVGAR